MRPWHYPMCITLKLPPGLATESRCTASCAPYKIPGEISGLSETRNGIRPSSTYGTSTRMERMVSLHQTAGEGMCNAQIAILPRGSSRNNLNKGWGNTRQMRETATAKAEIDPRVCMLITTTIGQISAGAVSSARDTARPNG